MKFSLIEIEITTIVSLFLLCLFSIQRYFFVACFTFRRDYDDSARYAFSAVESGIEIMDDKMDGSLSRIIFRTIRRSISVVCETNYGLHRNKPHRSNVSILRYITNASGRGKFEVRHV